MNGATRTFLSLAVIRFFLKGDEEIIRKSVPPIGRLKKENSSRHAPRAKEEFRSYSVQTFRDPVQDLPNRRCLIAGHWENASLVARTHKQITFCLPRATKNRTDRYFFAKDESLLKEGFLTAFCFE